MRWKRKETGNIGGAEQGPREGGETERVHVLKAYRSKKYISGDRNESFRLKSSKVQSTKHFYMLYLI